MSFRVQSILAVALISLPIPSWALQNTGKKPVLIRADSADEDQQPDVILPDPEKAKEHLEIGDFYFKRGNYKAAEERYRDAIRYLPSWAEPYRKLTRLLEKQGDFPAAVKICEEFIQVNPDADKVERFRKKAEQLRTKAGSTVKSSR